MPGPSIQLTRITNDPSLKDLLDTLKKDIMLNLNCHAIATVQSFDPANLTVSASINYSKTYFIRNSNTGEYVPKQVNYPLLTDCPVIILGGGPAALTFPIQQGDECLILFNDRDLDNWFAGATSGPVATPRLHSLSDGIALIGFKNSIDSYDSSRAVLRNGTTGVGVGPDLVKIYNASFTLNGILQDIMTQLESLATATGNTGIATALTALAVELGQLLE